MKRLRKLFRSLMLLAIASILIFNGCKKDDENTSETVIYPVYQAADDNSQGDGFTEDADKIAGAYLITSQSLFKNGENGINILSKCATISTIDTLLKGSSAEYYKVIIDFGSTYCKCIDGRFRKGKIILTFGKIKNYFEAGFTDTIRFDGYYVNQHHISCKYRSITNKGLNTNNNLNWDIDAKEVVIRRPSGKSHSWNSERNRELKIGNPENPVLEDIKYSITGNSWGKTINGIDYTVAITSPVIIKWGCPYIVSGILDIERTGKPKLTLDYGMETDCDDKATVTYNGMTYIITLK